MPNFTASADCMASSSAPPIVVAAWMLPSVKQSNKK
jgi:hypothetical protein